MPAVVVVFGLPVADHDLGVEQRVEAVDVQALVAEPAVERLDVPVVPGRAGRDVEQAGAGAGPVGHRVADELGAVVGSEHRGGAADGDEVLEVGGEPVRGDRPFDEPADALAGVLVDDGADLDRTALLVRVELEVHRPHEVRCDRCRGVDGRRPNAFAATPLRDAQPFLAPEPLDLLVVHDPPLAAGIVVGPAVSPPRVLLRIRPQPVPQRQVRVGCRLTLERATVCGPAQPGQTARHSFAHPQLALEVVDGGAAPARA